MVEGLAAVTSSDRLHLVTDGVGFEPTERPCTFASLGGSPECKSGAFSRSATRPVRLRLARPVNAGAGFSLASLLLSQICCGLVNHLFASHIAKLG